MNFIQLIGLNGLGVKVAIIAAITAVSEFMLLKLRGRVPNFIVNYVPLAISIVGIAVADCITSRAFALSEELLYGGLTAYSLGTVAFVAVKKLLKGEKPEDAIFLLVQGVAEGVCKDVTCAEIAEIARILKTLSDENAQSLKENVIVLLKKAAKDDVSDAEITAVAELILLSAQNFIKER